MDEPIINIETKDCLFFDNNYSNSKIITDFIKSQQHNIFRISNKRFKDKSKLAEYDYLANKWRAGRYIGEAYLKSNDKNYKITIKPRFGEQVLFYMLENIFNIKITKSSGEYNKDENWLNYIKKIIAYIWVQKLANANLQGVPKKTEKKEYYGATIKGRLSVRQSILPLYQKKQLVSISRQKEINPIIANIILSAFDILKKDFSFEKINIPNTAIDALNQFSTKRNNKHISENDYNSIKYNEIYLSWKSIVDFSWDIIKNKNLSFKQNSNKNQQTYGFFMDMAEIWEQYLRTILKKNLMPHGWNLINKKQIAYDNYFFKRELIPDIVFKKNNEIIVFDAKYKRMLGRPIDIDRSDFFQIHTYILNFMSKTNIIAGGLLYPISKKEINFNEYKSDTLIHKNGVKTKFLIDGIQLFEEDNNTEFKQKEAQFLDRIIKNI